MKMLNNEKAVVGAKMRTRRRRPLAKPHAISPTPLITPSKEESRAKVSPNRITGWIKAHKSILILTLIMLVGGFLRLYELGAESLWLDEVNTVNVSGQSLSSIILDTSTPLYFIITHFWMIIFGSSELAVRFPSAIFGIISIFLLYKIGYHLFNQKIGLISSFLLAISSFHIFYSQDARFYGLLLLLTLLSFYLFVQILKGNSKWYYLGYALANILLVYNHLFGVFVIISQVFYFALFWKKYKQQRIKYAAMQIATILALIPLMVYVIGNDAGRLMPTWVSEPSPVRILETLAAWSGYFVAGQFLLVVFFALSVIGVLSIRWFKGTSSTRFESVEEITMLLIWFSFPIFIPFLLSYILNPMYIDRYLIAALPAFLLLTAKGIAGINTFLSESLSNKFTYGIIIFIALISFAGLIQYYTEPTKEQWRETAAYIEYHAQADDSIVFCADYTQNPFDYYYEGDLEKFGIAWGETDTQNIDAVVDNASAGKERLWLVLSNQGTAITEEYLLSNFGSQSVIEHEELVGVEVYLFELPTMSPRLR